MISCSPRKPLRQRVRKFRNVAGAHDYNGVAGGRIGDDVGLDHVEGRRINRVLVAKALELVDKRRRCYSLDRIFSGWIDVQNQDDIRQIEGAGKVIEEVKCS